MPFVVIEEVQINMLPESKFLSAKSDCNSYKLLQETHCRHMGNIFFIYELFFAGC